MFHQFRITAARKIQNMEIFGIKTSKQLDTRITCLIHHENIFNKIYVFFAKTKTSSQFCWLLPIGHACYSHSPSFYYLWLVASCDLPSTSTVRKFIQFRFMYVCMYDLFVIFNKESLFYLIYIYNMLPLKYTQR